jgi:hypothetical protein
MQDQATIVVSFGAAGGGAAAGHLSAELDSREDGLNGGQTGFSPGQPAYILAYRTPNVVITSVVASAGTVTPQGTVAVTVAEELSFDDSRTATLQKPVAGAALASVEWFGTSLGALELQDDKVTVQAADKGVAVCRVTYVAVPDVYKLQSPASINGQTDFPILVLIQGTTT